MYGCRSKAVIDDKHQRIEHRTLGNAASDWKRAEFKSFPPNKLKSFFLVFFPPIPRNAPKLKMVVISFFVHPS